MRTPNLLIVGGRDQGVLMLNEEARRKMALKPRIEAVPGACHLFEEPETLAQVSRLRGLPAAGSGTSLPGEERFPRTNRVNLPQAEVKKILIVDDHPVLREGLEKVIEAQQDLTACGSAGSVEEALSLVECTAPDIVLTDLSLPGRNGVELIKDLRVLHPELPVLVMSMHDELIYAERVLRAGGKGYLMKEAPSATLLRAIRRVLEGGVFVSEAVTAHFLEGLTGGGRSQKASFPLQRLTDREMEVFELIGRGKGNQDIARSLFISPRTVDAHKAHIREKLGLADGNELTRYAVRWVESKVLE